MRNKTKEEVRAQQLEEELKKAGKNGEIEESGKTDIIIKLALSYEEYAEYMDKVQAHFEASDEEYKKCRILNLYTELVSLTDEDGFCQTDNLDIDIMTGFVSGNYEVEEDYQIEKMTINLKKQ